MLRLPALVEALQSSDQDEGVAPSRRSARRNGASAEVRTFVMAYVIASTCIDVKDGACQDVCPVECIYEGGRMMYIQPDECIDCGLCLSVCPVDAIYAERRSAGERARIRARQCRVLWAGDHRLGLARRRRLGPRQRARPSAGRNTRQVTLTPPRRQI